MTFLAFLYVGILANDSYLNDRKWDHEARRFGSYPNSGYFKINPDEILLSPAQDDRNVFTPYYLENLGLAEPFSDTLPSWSQLDYMKVANALSQYVWNEALDLTHWNIYQINFQTDCQIKGYYYASLVYYKPIGKNSYTTRLIEIEPYFGYVRWGSDATYQQPIIHKWKGVNWDQVKFQVDDALKIADDNGGDEVRRKERNECSIYIYLPFGEELDNNRWEIVYLRNHVSEIFIIYVDPYTGEFEIPPLD